LNRKTERIVPYYDYFVKMCQKHLGRNPSRTTLWKYLSNGYPVAKGGPYIKIPVFESLKRPTTTREAMSRFLTLVRKLEKDNGLRTING